MKKNPGGRPPIGPEYKTKLPDSIHEMIAALAEAEGITRSAWGRHAIVTAVEKAARKMGAPS